MYSNIQKQCLHQLGVQPYQLRSQESSSGQLKAPLQQVETSKNERPSLSSLLKSNEALFDWKQAPESFKKDLSVIIGEQSFSGDTLTLSQGIVWRVDDQQKSVSCEQQGLVSMAPDKLSVEDKKSIWQWLARQEGIGEN